MSNEVSNADIYNVLINMRGDLGRLEGKVDGHATTLTTHIADDKIVQAATVKAIEELRAQNSERKGSWKTVALFGGSLVGVVEVIEGLKSLVHFK
jgi:hypothetical protein